MDTIIACASPWGIGGISIIRISGPDSLPILEKLTNKKKYPSRKLILSHVFGDKEKIDDALISFMPGPNSFTGEDVVEIFCHGNPIIVEMIIDRSVVFGARPARPGEFSRQAVLNNKFSILQAEALNGLIHSKSIHGVKWAHKNLSGNMDKGLKPLKEKLLDICAELEARLDYPQENLGYVQDLELIASLDKISDETHRSAQTWRAGRIRLNGAKVAILGPVNSGKSSLFNHFVGHKRALVSTIPGTTRDVIEKSILIDGLEVCFMDTAGTRSDTEDPIEAQGIEMGLEMAEEVDICLLLSSLKDPQPQVLQFLRQKLCHKRILIIGTHLDQESGAPAFDVDLKISNESGEGIEKLRNVIRQQLGEMPTSGEKWIVLSQRQHELLGSISVHCREASNALTGEFGPAIAAEEITQAIERMAELSGSDAREDVLDRLFSKFCIGK